MQSLRATSLVISALTLCATAGAQSADELGSPAPAPTGAYAQPFTTQNLAVLHDNGPWITGTGNGFGGADTSSIEAGWNTFGYGTNQAAGVRLADDFTVPAATTWNLDTMTWRAYQTGSSTTGTMTAATIQIWDGPPGAGGTVIAGDTATNRLVAQPWTGVYKVTDTTLMNTQRPVMDLEIDMSWAPALTAGTYWVDIGLTGSLASGPWSPPTNPSAPTDNGRQLLSGVWAPTQDSFTLLPQDFPFVLEDGGGCVAPSTYCTAKTTSSGCVPAIGFTGGNDVSAPLDFAITGSMLQPSQPAVVIWSAGGPNAAPFQGGFLCIAPPVNRLGVQNTGAGGMCGGVINQPAAQGVLSSVGAGNTAWFQIWFRDGGDAFGSGLTNGLEVPICP